MVELGFAVSCEIWVDIVKYFSSRTRRAFAGNISNVIKQVSEMQDGNVLEWERIRSVSKRQYNEINTFPSLS